MHECTVLVYEHTWGVGIVEVLDATSGHGLDELDIDVFPGQLVPNVEQNIADRNTKQGKNANK